MSLSTVRCPVCDRNAARVVEAAEPPYRVLRCLSCDLRFVHPLPDPAALVTHYGADYYAEWITAQKARRRSMWERRLQAIERVAPTGRLLDVGCGDGAFLLAAKDRGWSVAGTEISAAAAALASDALGQPVFRGEVWEVDYRERSFDAITLWHALEHTTQPLRVLKAARSLLAPGGRLVVAVPNADNRVMQLAYRLARGRKPHLFSIRDRELHLYHFTVPSLSYVLARAGFACDEIGPDDGIVEFSIQLINRVATLLSRCLNVSWYNSIRVVARSS